MEWKKEGYIIKVSTRKGKKYDVYDKDDKYVTSFGAYPMEHYHDKIGYYSDLDHEDKKRRANFKSRFRQLINQKDKTSGIYWSAKFLW